MCFSFWAFLDIDKNPDVKRFFHVYFMSGTNDIQVIVEKSTLESMSQKCEKRHIEFRLKMCSYIQQNNAVNVNMLMHVINVKILIRNIFYAN